MRKTFQIAALLVVALLSACSGGEEKKEGTQEEAAQLNKPVVKLASVTSREVEQIEEIERFIDREYYEVLPQFVIQNAENIISEITADFN